LDPFKNLFKAVPEYDIKRVINEVVRAVELLSANRTGALIVFSSLNGADKEADNIVSIKKIQMNDGKEYPYCSSQAVRRALREQLASMGWELSETTVAKQKKGAASTLCEPSKYIDDDLFGFMNADSSKTVKGQAL